MRVHLAGASAILALVTLSACGSENGSGGGGESSQSESSQSESSQSESSDAVTITDSQGRDVEVALDPETVVATDWSAIRTLSDLGVEVDAVPVPNGGLPEDLSGYASEDVPKVGDVFEPDYEAIAAMEPDLVVVGSRSGTPEVVEEFEKFAPAVLDMSVRTENPAEMLEETGQRVRQLGEVFNKTDDAEKQMTDLESQVEETRSKVEEQGRTAMFVQVSEGTVGAYGPTSRFGFLYEGFGFAPTDAPIDEEGSHGEEISQEFFAQYNPGALFVLDRSKAIGQSDTPALDVLDNDLVGGTDAAQDDKIVEVDGFSWYLAPNAPSSLQQMVGDVGQAL
ncbi:MAG: ABC transporter substrate-binding protein [Ornithinimicrobium sp.]